MCGQRSIGAEMEAEGGRTAGDQSEDDSAILNSLHASLALVDVDLTDSPPPVHAVPHCGLWE